MVPPCPDIEDYYHCALNYGLPFRPSVIKALGLFMTDYERRAQAQTLASRLMTYIEDASSHVSEGLYLSLSNTLAALCKVRTIFPPDDSDEVAFLQDSIGILEDEYDHLDHHYRALQERHNTLLEDSIRKTRARTGLISSLIEILQAE